MNVSASPARSPPILTIISLSSGMRPRGSRHSIRPSAPMSISVSQHEETPLPLRPPRFGLRTVWLVVSIACAVLGLLAAVSGVAAITLLVFVGLVICHVAGNAIGTSLTDQTTAQIRSLGQQATKQQLSPEPITFAPTTRLGTRKRGIGRAVAACCLCGAMIGGVSGTALFVLVVPASLEVQELVLAISSTSLLGGLAGFGLSTFAGEMLAAWREASRPTADSR